MQDWSECANVMPSLFFCVMFFLQAHSRVTSAYTVSSKEEVDQVLEQVKIAGATIVKTAQDVFWGGYSGYFPISTVTCGKWHGILIGHCIPMAI